MEDKKKAADTAVEEYRELTELANEHAVPVVATQEQPDQKKPMSDYEKALAEYKKHMRATLIHQQEAYFHLLKILDGQR